MWIHIQYKFDKLSRLVIFVWGGRRGWERYPFIYARDSYGKFYLNVYVYYININERFNIKSYKK